MAQVGWVFLDDFGGQHRIGLYHGDSSGHVLLHCDLRVVQVDFSVKEPRTYSFFVEDELCEVSIYKEKEGFSYDFKVNKKVDTPRNRLRKADNRRNQKYIAYLTIGLLVTIACTFFALRWWGKQHSTSPSELSSLNSGLSPENAQRLAMEGATAVARLVVVSEAQERRIYYGFSTADDRQVSGRFSAPDTGAILLPNGFPLHDGHAFSVRYLPASPGVHRVDFDLPTQPTLDDYFQRAFLAEQGAHPEASNGRSRCIAQLTLEKKGWRQLADLIFQTTPPERNALHNRDSYHRLVREPEFAQLIERECWDK
ncbi:MAG: hypothetical protein JNK89_04765 [Saprospiraceae bacterium]|nr:hypothetical protein [Saprospiraceae bacterium]